MEKSKGLTKKMDQPLIRITGDSCLIRKFIFYVLFFILATGQSAKIPALQKNTLHKKRYLPAHVLAFPEGSYDHERKIFTNSGPYEIWSENKIYSWAKSQGVSVTADSDTAGLKFRRGIIFKPPGLFFELGIGEDEISEKDRLGWSLNLDMGFFKEDLNKESIRTNFKNYDNLIRYEVFVNGIPFKTIEIGYGRMVSSPVKIRIPFIRNSEGKVIVKIKLSNRVDNFGILYDAFLVKEMR